MSNIDKQALNQEKIEWLNKLADMEYCKSNPGHWLMSLKDTNMLAKLALRSVALLDELEAKDRRIAEQKEVMRQAASDISYAIFNLTGSDLSRLQPGVVETTDPTDTALIAERNLRAAAAGKGE